MKARKAGILGEGGRRGSVEEVEVEGTMLDVI
jgi:hypothetical protein